MRGLVQAEQGTGLLDEGGVVREIVTRQVGKTKLVLWRKLVGQLQLDGLRGGLGLGDQLRRGGFFKLQQDVGGLDLDAFSAVKLHLRGRVRLRQNTSGHEFTGFFKQCIHGLYCYTPRLRFALANPLAGGSTSGLAKPVPRCLLEETLCALYGGVVIRPAAGSRIRRRYGLCRSRSGRGRRLPAGGSVRQDTARPFRASPALRHLWR